LHVRQRPPLSSVVKLIVPSASTVADPSLSVVLIAVRSPLVGFGAARVVFASPDCPAAPDRLSAPLV
jgi:hypothetical protein